jgi:hypothetical protein
MGVYKSACDYESADFNFSLGAHPLGGNDSNLRAGNRDAANPIQAGLRTEDTIAVQNDIARLCCEKNRKRGKG